VGLLAVPRITLVHWLPAGEGHLDQWSNVQPLVEPAFSVKESYEHAVYIQVYDAEVVCVVQPAPQSISWTDSVSTTVPTCVALPSTADSLSTRR
jgi:hypothetical protein